MLAQAISENTGESESTRSGVATKVKPEPEMKLKDTDMYTPLTYAFNAACPPLSLKGEKMRCCDIGSSELPLITSIKVLPDIALSFDYHPDGTHDVFLHPAVYIEVKADEVFDLPFQKDQRYVNLGQASELPWDYLYFITITGPVARIWKFTHTGYVITTPIRYLESPDNLIRFMRALALNGRSGFGISVGQGRLFTEYTDGNLYSEGLRHVADTYAKAVNNQNWITRRGPSGCWLLKIEPKELFHRVDSAMAVEPNQATEYLVFKRPLYSVESMFSRRTRRYLAITKEDIEDPVCSSLSARNVIAKLRLVKTSWQYEDTTPEAYFFRKYDERHITSRPCGIPTLLASGTRDVQPEIRSQTVKPISIAWEDPVENLERGYCSHCPERLLPITARSIDRLGVGQGYER
ncbi:hypothetical protein PIIN_10935 [Serendipita indica DSM 11827]|uniref:Fungal-type protein kinase domain-containing protein n=1 Tax=Serendipita indica (strain DSM 11827) TaxID=1109443 RepID=G4U059_SERID|nr:hypothetical protein PIIN_10935 [Serendipita indica DSM 11827]